MKNKSKLPFLECLLVLLGEVIVSLIVCLVYFIIQKFTYKVVTGVLLGTLVTVLNFLFLAISTNRILDKAAADSAREALCKGMRVFRYENTPASPASCYIPLPEENSVVVIPADERMVSILKGVPQ